jgi:hypothetical protein
MLEGGNVPKLPPIRVRNRELFLELLEILKQSLENLKLHILFADAITHKTRIFKMCNLN